MEAFKKICHLKVENLKVAKPKKKKDHCFININAVISLLCKFTISFLTTFALLVIFHLLFVTLFIFI